MAWLVSGDVNIDGVVDLNGEAANDQTIPQPGPGGLRGGGPFLSESNPASGGFGPGGAPYSVGAGSYGTVGVGTPRAGYGNASVLPLIGGSGGTVHAMRAACVRSGRDSRSPERTSKVSAPVGNALGIGGTFQERVAPEGSKLATTLKSVGKPVTRAHSISRGPS